MGKNLAHDGHLLLPLPTFLCLMLYKGKYPWFCADYKMHSDLFGYSFCLFIASSMIRILTGP